MAAFPWNRWQLWRGISGSFRLEWVAGLLWNQWQLWRGTGGSIPVESVAALAWNTQSIAEDDVEEQGTALARVMSEAADIAVGIPIRVDLQVVRPGERLLTAETRPMWDNIMELLDLRTLDTRGASDGVI